MTSQERKSLARSSSRAPSSRRRSRHSSKSMIRAANCSGFPPSPKRRNPRDGPGDRLFWCTPRRLFPTTMVFLARRKARRESLQVPSSPGIVSLCFRGLIPWPLTGWMSVRASVDEADTRGPDIQAQSCGFLLRRASGRLGRETPPACFLEPFFSTSGHPSALAASLGMPCFGRRCNQVSTASCPRRISVDARPTRENWGIEK